MGKTLDAEEFLSWLNEAEEELKGERADELNPDRKDEGILLATENVRKYVEKMCKIDDADEDCRWIPVTERLPEDESDVLTTITSKSGSGYREYSVGCYIKVFDEDEEKHWLDRQYGYLEWDRYSNGHGGCSLYKVTAWMPLPKLYKG